MSIAEEPEQALGEALAEADAQWLALQSEARERGIGGVRVARGCPPQSRKAEAESWYLRSVSVRQSVASVVFSVSCCSISR